MDHMLTTDLFLIEYDCENLGLQYIKGKGEVVLYKLKGKKRVKGSRPMRKESIKFEKQTSSVTSSGSINLADILKAPSNISHSKSGTFGLSAGTTAHENSSDEGGLYQERKSMKRLSFDVNVRPSIDHRSARASLDVGTINRSTKSGTSSFLPSTRGSMMSTDSSTHAPPEGLSSLLEHRQSITSIARQGRLLSVTDQITKKLSSYELSSLIEEEDTPASRLDLSVQIKPTTDSGNNIVVPTASIPTESSANIILSNGSTNILTDAKSTSEAPSEKEAGLEPVLTHGNPKRLSLVVPDNVFINMKHPPTEEINTPDSADIDTSPTAALFPSFIEADGNLGIPMSLVAKRTRTQLSRQHSKKSIEYSKWTSGPLSRPMSLLSRKHVGAVIPESPDASRKPALKIDPAKEVVKDVVLLMLEKVKNQKDVSLDENTRYINAILSEMHLRTLFFKHKSLEEQFKADFITATWARFMRACFFILLTEILLLLLGLTSFYLNYGGFSQSSNGFVMFIGSVFGSAGLLVIITTLIMIFDDLSDAKQSIKIREFHYVMVVISLVVAGVTVSLPWTGLNRYPFMVGGTIPQIVAYSIMRIEGIFFIYRTRFTMVVLLGMTVLQHVLNQTDLQITLSVFACSAIMFASIMGLSRLIRIQYLLDVIMDAQSDIVLDEIEKSANLLYSILPDVVISKLVEAPSSIVYEELIMVSVLFMDIVGFTSMSSDKEPLIIVEMLNTLFTYLDKITEDYNVEKVTTIGDAYVAVTSFNNDLDPQIGAICLSIVALLLQRYVGNELNALPVVTNNFSAAVSCRVGLHTGPAAAAIMGGPKNFRYNLLGETIDGAEKVQSASPPGAVGISNSTHQQISDFTAFGFEPHPAQDEDVLKNAYILKAVDESALNIAADDIVVPVADWEPDVTAANNVSELNKRRSSIAGFNTIAIIEESDTIQIDIPQIRRFSFNSEFSAPSNASLPLHNSLDSSTTGMSNDTSNTSGKSPSRISTMGNNAPQGRARAMSIAAYSPDPNTLPGRPGTSSTKKRPPAFAGATKEFMMNREQGNTVTSSFLNPSSTVRAARGSTFFTSGADGMILPNMGKNSRSSFVSKSSTIEGNEEP